MYEPGLRTVEEAQTSAPRSCGAARHLWAVNSAKPSGNGPTKPAPMRTNVATNADFITGGLTCQRRASIYQAMSQTKEAFSVMKCPDERQSASVMSCVRNYGIYFGK